jgi:hypothetical protein
MLLIYYLIIDHQRILLGAYLAILVILQGKTQILIRKSVLDLSISQHSAVRFSGYHLQAWYKFTEHSGWWQGKYR